MLRSLNAGVSGLRNQQVRLDVIGNNIANVNTVGYKAHRVSFQDQFSQTMSGASAPEGGMGGTNPTQVGMGVTVGSIDLVQTQGSLMTTGKNTDLAISGEGFFMVSDGKQQVYTRDGSFDFDRQGNLVKVSNGMRVMGWNAQIQPDGTSQVTTSRPVEPLVVPAGITLTPQPTQNIKIGSNLEALTPDVTDPDPAKAKFASTMVAVTMYDSEGNQLKGSIKFTKHATAGGNPNSWDVAFVPADPTQWNLTVPSGTTPWTPADTSVNPNIPAQLAMGSVQFDQKGLVSGFNDNATDQSITATSPLILTPSSVATAPISFNLDLGSVGKNNGLTQYTDAKTDVSKDYYNDNAVMTEQDGYGSGALSGVNLDKSGYMIGIFTNGRTRVLGQVALANFTNPAGLSVNGDNVFSSTPNSGEPQIGVADSGARGGLVPGSLENSNVDLAQSFSDLIVAQRGLQSNSKIITTSDEVLQELMNLKR